jgi:hypothetical protein
MTTPTTDASTSSSSDDEPPRQKLVVIEEKVLYYTSEADTDYAPLPYPQFVEKYECGNNHAYHILSYCRPHHIRSDVGIYIYMR